MDFKLLYFYLFSLSFFDIIAIFFCLKHWTGTFNAYLLILIVIFFIMMQGLSIFLWKQLK